MIKKAIQLANVYGNTIFCHLRFIKDPVHVAHTADFLLNYKGMRWSFCTGRYKDRLYFSLRSSKTNAFAHRVLRDVLADEAQAGGHGPIAGGNLYVGRQSATRSWRKVEADLAEKLIERLHVKGKKKIFCAPPA